jgi:hypothetical protein
MTRRKQNRNTLHDTLHDSLRHGEVTGSEEHTREGLSGWLHEKKRGMYDQWQERRN